VSRLGVHKILGGDTVGIADPKWPKGYSTPYHVTFSNKNWRGEAGERDAFQGLVEHLSVCGECLFSFV